MHGHFHTYQQAAKGYQEVHIVNKLVLSHLMFALFILCLAARAQESREIYNLVRVRIDSSQDIRHLLALGLEITKIHQDDTVEVAARDMDMSALDEKGLNYEIEIRDMASYFEKRLQTEYSGGRGFPNGSMGGYYTLSEIETMLDDWAVQYPHLITPKTSIGKSIENRDIWASTKPPGVSPSFLQAAGSFFPAPRPDPPTSRPRTPPR